MLKVALYHRPIKNCRPQGPRREKVGDVLHVTSDRMNLRVRSRRAVAPILRRALGLRADFSTMMLYPTSPEAAVRFLKFVNASPTPFHAVHNAAARLEKAGFQKVHLQATSS